MRRATEHRACRSSHDGDLDVQADAQTPTVPGVAPGSSRRCRPAARVRGHHSSGTARNACAQATTLMTPPRSSPRRTATRRTAHLPRSPGSPASDARCDHGAPSLSPTSPRVSNGPRGDEPARRKDPKNRARLRNVDNYRLRLLLHCGTTTPRMPRIRSGRPQLVA